MSGNTFNGMCYKLIKFTGIFLDSLLKAGNYNAVGTKSIIKTSSTFVKKIIKMEFSFVSFDF